jgi:hypothetical protein
MRRMGWFKLAAIVGGVIIAFLIVGSVVHFILAAITTVVIAALVAGGVYVAIKVARSGKKVSGKRAEREVREPDPETYRRPLPRSDVEPASPRPRAEDVDDDLAKLKRELGL